MEKDSNDVMPSGDVMGVRKLPSEVAMATGPAAGPGSDCTDWKCWWA